MRTIEEIKKKIAESKSFFGFEASVWIGFLPFSDAKEHLKPEATEEIWEKERAALNREGVLKEMGEYMSFAWEKVLDHRGISASRSVEKLGAWLWVIEDDEVCAEYESIGYPNYGAPKLRWLCERYGFPMPDSPEAARMADGDSCHPGCDEGCGQ